MALKVSLTTLMMVACMTFQFSSTVSLADDTSKLEWDDTVNSIVHGIEWLAQNVEKVNGFAQRMGLKEGKYLKPDEVLLKKSDREARHLDETLEEIDNKIDGNEDEASVAEEDAEGRLFFTNPGTGTSVTVNTQAIQTAIGGLIFVGLAILAIILIISLVTGRDFFSLANGFSNRFTEPFSDHWHNAAYNNQYRDESTYTSYRAFEDAAKKYDEDKQ